MQGTVRNVIDFGAFVEIGIKNDGLVHISQLSNGFVKHPMDVVSVGDNVTVWVLNVDTKKGRVGLTMRKPGNTES
ncbi:30S ribosomal protein S1 [compost metagenome]